MMQHLSQNYLIIYYVKIKQFEKKIGFQKKKKEKPSK